MTINPTVEGAFTFADSIINCPLKASLWIKENGQAPYEFKQYDPCLVDHSWIKSFISDGSGANVGKAGQMDICVADATLFAAAGGGKMFNVKLTIYNEDASPPSPLEMLFSVTITHYLPSLGAICTTTAVTCSTSTGAPIDPRCRDSELTFISKQDDENYVINAVPPTPAKYVLGAPVSTTTDFGSCPITYSFEYYDVNSGAWVPYQHTDDLGFTIQTD